MSNPHKVYENHLDEQEARWFAVYTRYKREKQVFKRLSERGIEVYLPLQKFTRRWTRKVREVELPLINCYLFVKITKEEYVRVLETQDVVQFVKFSKNLLSIPENEIDILRRVVGEGVEIEAEPSSYHVGDDVEVIGGNLTGLKGKLVKKDNDKNFLVELNNLGFSLRMYIQPDLLSHARKRYAV
jgi:transcription antitermination factor NusG